MYRVIRMFTDLQDGNHRYEVGDEYPRLGLEVSDSRLDELATDKNRRKTPLIKLEEEPKPIKAEAPEVEAKAETVVEPKNDSEPIAEEAPKKKRKTKNAE